MATGKKTAKKARVATKDTAKRSKAKARTKSEVVTVLAESTGLTRKEVSGVFDALSELIASDLGTRGPGIFSVPGLMKIVKVKKPATKQRKGINPFTGEPTVFAAKPARNVVKVRPLKGSKEMVVKG